MTFITIKVRFEIHGLIYGFVMDQTGIQIALLSGNTDRPDILQIIYTGTNIHTARSCIADLAG